MGYADMETIIIVKIKTRITKPWTAAGSELCGSRSNLSLTPLPFLGAESAEGRGEGENLAALFYR